VEEQKDAEEHNDEGDQKEGIEETKNENEPQKLAHEKIDQ
jgi:hypothetical protein